MFKKQKPNNCHRRGKRVKIITTAKTTVEKNYFAAMTLPRGPDALRRIAALSLNDLAKL